MRTEHNHAPLPAPDTPPGELVPASMGERPINLDFETYRPVRPLTNKVRGENLLWHTLMHAGSLERWDDALHALQRHFGRDRLVWGVQLEPLVGPRAWQLRVLNQGPDADHPQGVLARVRELLAPYFALAPELDLSEHDYEILSLHFSTAPEAGLAPVSVHTHVRRADSRTFEHHRHAPPELAQVVAKEQLCEPKREVDRYLPFLEAATARLLAQPERALGRVLIPELFACRRLHLRVPGPEALALTFSGVNVEQLMFTYKRFEFPQPMVEFLAELQDRLAHLLWDVEVEFASEQRARLTYPRVTVYGSL